MASRKRKARSGSALFCSLTRDGSGWSLVLGILLVLLWVLLWILLRILLRILRLESSHRPTLRDGFLGNDHHEFRPARRHSLLDREPVGVISCVLVQDGDEVVVGFDVVVGPFLSSLAIWLPV